ncbi:Crp/Fnr family transcriptional regulator [Mesoflavibacter profundi]|uniref:Crp/Fnr family transcriptional regulator n=1 Tax=Mesoflavibacter profundi TaxID=2708110 RepID=A0ABT4RY46_9FLAO|nr:Crp/Fnr family transcriptional regulator [Mesoflavibacter profundi]MDA0176717.1 Crp/Fnr family transcriptional regulator [Mesoflavibacter profundi]
MFEKKESYSLEDVMSRVRTFSEISDESFAEIVEVSKVKSVKSGIVLDDVGVVPTKIYVILKGYCRSYFRLENGKEITKTFFKPLDIFASFNALINQVKSDCIYETLTDCELFELDYFDYLKLRDKNCDLFRFHSHFMEYLICLNDVKHKELLSMNATQRYLSLRKQIPNIDNLIPQYQIASYLSITPVQLSRIRAKL